MGTGSEQLGQVLIFWWLHLRPYPAKLIGKPSDYRDSKPLEAAWLQVMH